MSQERVSGLPEEVWGTSGEVWETSGEPLDCWLSSTVRELPGKSPKNFRGSSGNFRGSPGKSGDFPEARA